MPPVDAGLARDRTGEQGEQLDPLILVRRIEAHLEPEPSGADQRAVEMARRAVRAGDDDRAGRRGEAVEGGQRRGQQEPRLRIVARVVAGHAEGVTFVDVEDGARMALGSGEVPFYEVS